MKIKVLRYAAVAAAALLTPLTAGATGTGPAPSVSGRAFVLKANIAELIDATFQDTGSLPSSGGTIVKDLKALSIPGLVYAEALHAKTTGKVGYMASSEARVAKVDLTIAGIVDVYAKLIASQTQAVCSYGKAIPGGDSVFDNIVIKVAGKPITIKDVPNATTTINLPLVGTVKVVLNETIKKNSSDYTYAAVTENAVHVIVKNLLGIVTANVIISSSYSDIQCRA